MLSFNLLRRSFQAFLALKEKEKEKNSMSKIGAKSFVFPQSHGIVDHEKKGIWNVKVIL